MPNPSLSPTLSSILTTASNSGEPCALSPANAGEILACCRFIDHGQVVRGRTTVSELMSVLNGGGWDPGLSEIAVARFPDGTLSVLNGHNRLRAFSQRDTPTSTRVRLMDVNDADDFNLLYSRFDAATTLRSFGMLARLQGHPVPRSTFSGKLGGASSSGKAATPVVASFIVESLFGERPRPIGMDGWKSISSTYTPIFSILSEMVAPLRARAGRLKLLHVYDNTLVTAVLVSMFKTDADLCKSFIRRLLGAEGGVDDSIRMKLWTRIDNLDHPMQWREAVQTLPMAVIQAWGSVRAGRRVGTFRRRPTGTYPIAGSRYVYRTKEALRKFKTAK